MPVNWADVWYLPAFWVGRCLTYRLPDWLTRRHLAPPPPQSGWWVHESGARPYRRGVPVRVHLLLDRDPARVVVAEGEFLMPDYDHFLRMARNMKAKNDEIVAAIYQIQDAQHGVVALVFTEQGRKMEIQILDEPFDDNVRVYPGE